MILYHPPKFTYSGLTIVLSNPSRFDTTRLLSANGGMFFDNECLRPYLNRHQCDIRLATDTRPLLPNTKAILLLGVTAFQRFFPLKYEEGILNKVRGTPLYTDDGILAIATFFPQDAVDKANHEENLNIWNKLNKQELASLSKKIDEKKRYGITSRSNYSFWIKKDTHKLINLMQNGVPESPKFEYVIYPNSKDIIDYLYSVSNTNVYLDIETNSDKRITCFAIHSPNNPVYVVPIVNHLYELAYEELVLAKIFRGLSRVFQHNTVVTHNGAGFDLWVLAINYKVIIGNNLYDTMLANHRIFPYIEKSLGHCVSLWTNEPFHKDEANFAFGSQAQAEALWKYCGKDVSTMRLVHEAQLAYAKKIPGLLESIKQVNASIRPYMLVSFKGIRYRPEKVVELMSENDRLMMQYLRAIKTLVGKELLPTSSKQCIEYFHEELGYPVIARSKKTKKPSLDGKALYKLLLKHPNPVINLVLAYRELSTETGKLKFIPWTNKI